MRTSRFLTAVLIASAIVGLAAPAGLGQSVAPGGFKAFAADPEQMRISAVSGLPVPRYASLKASEVNGRAGPSMDYPVAWRYRRAGLPVVIVRESADWRKVRDPVGDEVWVHRTMLSAARTVIAVADGALRRGPDPRSKLVATFSQGAVMMLKDCSDGWCEVSAEGRPGHVPRHALWGADDLPQPR
jgi:SH3-like domain-containing protein